VKFEIRKIRRCVACGAVSGVLRTVDSRAGGFQKNLQSRELGGAESEWLRVILEFAVGAVDPDRIRQRQRRLVERLIVLLGRLTSGWLRRQVIDA